MSARCYRGSLKGGLRGTQRTDGVRARTGRRPGVQRGRSAPGEHNACQLLVRHH